MKIQLEKNDLPHHPDLNHLRPLHPPLAGDCLIYGGGDDDWAWLWDGLNSIGSFLWWTLCCPCAFIHRVVTFDPGPLLNPDLGRGRRVPDKNSNPLDVKGNLNELAQFAEVKDPAYFLVSNPEEYYAALELLLKNLIFQYRKLEKELKSAPKENQEQIKTRLLNSLSDLANGVLCAPRRYGETLYQFRKISDHPETLFNRLATLIQDIKEDIFIFEPREIEDPETGIITKIPGDMHELNAIRKKYGPLFGLNTDPVLISDPGSKTAMTEQQARDLLTANFTQDRVFQALLIKMNDDTDANKELYNAGLRQLLDDRLTQAWKDAERNKKDPMEAQSSILDLYFVRGKKALTLEAATFLFNHVDDPAKGQLSDLFRDGQISWDRMMMAPEPFDLEQIAKNNDLTDIRLGELPEIYERVSAFEVH